MNRWIHLSLACALGLGLARADGEKEAKALFDAMEAKFNEAKTLRVKVKSSSPKMELNYEVCLAGQKLRFALTGTEDGAQPVEQTLVSDGTLIHMSTGTPQGSRSKSNPAPPKLGDTARAALIRGSVVFLFQMLGAADEELFKVKNFALGPKEKGERTLQVVEYDCLTPGGTMRAKLWIDTVTGLPTKRTLTRGEAADGQVLTQTFTAVELDPKLPEGAFSPPGEDEAKPTSKPAK